MRNLCGLYPVESRRRERQERQTLREVESTTVPNKRVEEVQRRFFSGEVSLEETGTIDLVRGNSERWKK